MLGVGLSTAAWLEGAGPWLNALGFLLLLASIFRLAWLKSRTGGAARPDDRAAYLPERRMRSEQT